MAAKWQFGSVGIYVTDEDISREIKRAELFILDATASTFHFFGAGTTKRSVKGMIIGDTDRDQLLSDAATDTGRYLQTPWQNIVGVKINGTPKFTAISYAGATIDGTTYTSDVTPLYNCELELIFP